MCFCGSSCYFSSFISSFVYLGSLCFSLGWVWLEACWFIFSEDQLLFCWSFLVLDLYFIYFLSDFIISFVLLTLGFVCSFFPNSFRCQVRLSEIFLVSWGRPVWLWTSLLVLFLLHPMGFRKLCFHFHLSWGICWFPLWFHCWPVVCSVACCLVSMCSFFSRFSYCGWFLVSHCCDQKRCLKWLLFWTRILKMTT